MMLATTENFQQAGATNKTHTNTHTHTYMIYINTHKHKHIYINTHKHTHALTYARVTHTHTHTYARAHARTERQRSVQKDETRASEVKSQADHLCTRTQEGDKHEAIKLSIRILMYLINPDTIVNTSRLPNMTVSRCLCFSGTSASAVFRCVFLLCCGSIVTVAVHAAIVPAHPPTTHPPSTTTTTTTCTHTPPEHPPPHPPTPTSTLYTQPPVFLGSSPSLSMILDVRHLPYTYFFPRGIYLHHTFEFDIPDVKHLGNIDYRCSQSH